MGLFRRKKDAKDGSSASGAQESDETIKDARDASSASSAHKSVETILRDTLLGASLVHNFSGAQQLELMEALRSIYNARFSQESIQKALRSDDPRIRTLVEVFVRDATLAMKNGD